jgi:hypothetical protein
MADSIDSVMLQEKHTSPDDIFIDTDYKGPDQKPSAIGFGIESEDDY